MTELDAKVSAQEYLNATTYADKISAIDCTKMASLSEIPI